MERFTTCKYCKHLQHKNKLNDDVRRCLKCSEEMCRDCEAVREIRNTMNERQLFYRGLHVKCEREIKLNKIINDLHDDEVVLLQELLNARQNKK